jgi:hypothetical protein
LLILGFLPAMAQANNPGGSTGPNGGSKPAPAHDVPPCAPAPAAVSGGKSQGSESPHSVTLSWKASVAPSKAAKDAIKGYYVYRSQTSRKYDDSDRLNPVALTGTSCVDRSVAPHTTYFYTIKSVTQGGELSVLSDEVKAIVPSP